MKQVSGGPSRTCQKGSRQWEPPTSLSPFATRPTPTDCGEGLFRVDTGAFDSLVPGPHPDAIGLKPKGKRVYELADGNEIVMGITSADIEFMGEIVGGTIRYGAPDAEPLLGLAALASVGIEVDPVNQRLKRRPAVRLKSLGTYVEA